jgi:RNA recognition motif-containing protein
VGEVSFVELFVDENDKPRGCGVIEFANPELAKEAVDKMHRYDLKGRKLVVKEDSDVERDKFGRVVPRGESGRGGGGGLGGGRLSGGRDDRGGSSWGDLPSLVNGPGGGAGGNASKWGNTYGLSIQFLESLSINGPLVPRCFVANVSAVINSKYLYNNFRKSKIRSKIIYQEVTNITSIN